MSHLFTAQTVVIMITVVKNKRKKRIPKKCINSARFDPGRLNVFLRLTTGLRRLSGKVNAKNLYLNKTSVIMTVNTSKVI